MHIRSSLAVLAIGVGLLSVRPGEAQIETFRFADGPGARALRALEAGDIEQALAISMRVLREARRLPAGREAAAQEYIGHSIACVCLRLERDFENAAEHCDTAVALAPGNWRGFTNRGALHFDAGDLAAARADFEAAARLAPKEPAVVANLRLVGDRLQ